MTELFQCISLETVNVCNRKCHFCKFGQPKGIEPYSRMPMHLIVKILLNLQDLKFTGRVSLFKINEPMMDRRIFDLVRLTKAILPDCYCTVLSNGDMIDGAACDKFKAAGLDNLSVSVYDDDTWRRITTLNWAYDEWIYLTDRRMPDDMYDNRGGNVVLDRTLPRDTQKKDCLRPSTMLNVNPDGKVGLCCVDFYNEVLMGDCSKQTLEEIWFSPEYERYRTELRSHGREHLKLCNTCDHHGGGHDKFFPKK